MDASVSLCNLLVTYDVQHREAAMGHAGKALVAAGARPHFLRDAPPGIFEVHVPGDARAVLARLRSMCREDPSRFAHTHHWRPVDDWARSTPPSMRQAAEALGKRIAAWDSWRLTVDIHGPSPLHAHDLIGPLTAGISQGVPRMRSPQKVLRVDIVANQAAFALLEPGDDLSVDQVRAAELAMPQDV
jgi:hypothetical protein